MKTVTIKTEDTSKIIEVYSAQHLLREINRIESKGKKVIGYIYH